MNVACPECASVFRVDPAKVPQAGVRARCSICGGIITIGRTGAIDEDFAAPAAVAPMAASAVGQGAQIGGGHSTPPSGMPAWSAARSQSVPPQSPPWGVPAVRPSPASPPAVSASAPALAEPPAPSIPAPPTSEPTTGGREEIAPSVESALAAGSIRVGSPEVAAALFEDTPPPIETDAGRVPAPTSDAVADSPQAPAIPEATAAGASPPGPMPAPQLIEPAIPPAASTRAPTPWSTPAVTFAPAPSPRAPTPISSPVVAPAVPPRTPTPAFGSPAQTTGMRAASPVPPSSAAPPAPRTLTGSQPAISDAPRARPPINPFLANDPNQKAKRLARALVSDIVTYFPDKHKEGLRNGTLKDLFREEIKKSYEEYVDQMGRQFAESTTHFQDALNDVLSGGRKIF